MYILNAIKKPHAVMGFAEADLPTVAVVIAAYNEAGVIKEKIQNTLAQDYPMDKLQICVVADGSTDETMELVRTFPSVILHYQPERKGKTAAINRVMPMIEADITVFTDANTLLNLSAIRNLVAHYGDPKVGGVSGEKQVMQVGAQTAAGTEGLYWKYESPDFGCISHVPISHQY